MADVTLSLAENRPATTAGSTFAEMRDAAHQEMHEALKKGGATFHCAATEGLDAKHRMFYIAMSAYSDDARTQRFLVNHMLELPADIHIEPFVAGGAKL